MPCHGIMMSLMKKDFQLACPWKPTTWSCTNWISSSTIAGCWHWTHSAILSSSLVIGIAFHSQQRPSAEINVSQCMEVLMKLYWAVADPLQDSSREVWVLQ